jgi:hypothetical protein
MKKIYKYSLPPIQKIEQVILPTSALIKNFHWQYTSVGDVKLYVWAEVDDDDCTVCSREFIVVGTGYIIPSVWTYLGTTHAPHGLVWHLYEREEK